MNSFVCSNLSLFIKGLSTFTIINLYNFIQNLVKQKMNLENLLIQWNKEWTWTHIGVVVVVDTILMFMYGHSTIRVNGEIENEEIVNMFIFILHYTISKWSQNFLVEHSNNIFVKFERAFCKWFKFVKNNEHVYMN